MFLRDHKSLLLPLCLGLSPIWFYVVFSQKIRQHTPGGNSYPFQISKKTLIMCKYGRKYINTGNRVFNLTFSVVFVLLVYVGSLAVSPHNLQKSEIRFLQREWSPRTIGSVSHPWERIQIPSAWNPQTPSPRPESKLRKLDWNGSVVISTNPIDYSNTGSTQTR